MIETRTQIRIPNTDVWFTPEGLRPERYEDLHVRELGIQVGLDIEDRPKWEVTWLVHDPSDTEFEWDDPEGDYAPEQWINGVFRDFRSNRSGGGQQDRDEFCQEMVELVGEDRVFIVEVYSHGLESFSIAGTGLYPDRRWDVAPACVLAVPPDVTNPREWAEGLLQTYTSWVNGDVWGIVSNRVCKSGRVWGDDAVWGIIGREYAEQEAKAGI